MPDSPAIRLVGMPKVDCLVNGSLQRDAIVRTLGLDPALPTVLYAPTWSPASSLNAMGLDLVRALLQRPINVMVKLHDRSRDLRERYSGGVDWVAALRPLMQGTRGAIAQDRDICPYLAASDLMITDHSSAGFEYLLLDRPLVRIHRPELLQLANVHPDYADLLDRWQTQRARLRRRWQPSRKGSPIHAPSAPRGARSPRISSISQAPPRREPRRTCTKAMALEGAPAGVTAQEAPCHS